MCKPFFFIPLIVIAALLVFGGAVMLLWNAILPPLVGVGQLSFWQAVGLLVLSKLLFGGTHWRKHHCGPSSGDGPPFLRYKWNRMTDEEREQWKAKWRSHCHWGGGEPKPGDRGDEPQ
ncbi:hypothetical protein HZB60_09740 [candidate division KSB1 bacterium]|nr:hypothetical protein [candidate division KSB1 bacterium]